jgi:serine/threonine-protein kinase RsbW
MRQESFEERTVSNHKSIQKCLFEDKNLIWKFHRTLPAKVEEINPVVEKILEETLLMGCAQGKEMQIETALREALANAITHGCRSIPNAEVEICVGCEKDLGILIVVRNPGKGFSPVSIPDPTHAQNIFSTHGRGIYLINQLMDEVRFEKNGTELHMRKR